MASIRAHAILDTARWVQGTTKMGSAMSGAEQAIVGSGLRIAAMMVGIGGVSSKLYADIDRDARRTVSLLDERNEQFLGKFIKKSREFSVAWGVNLKEVVAASYQAFSLGKNWENYTDTMETAIKATKTYGGTLTDNINLLLKFERILGLSNERIMDMAATTIQLGDTKLEYLSQYMTEVTGLTKNLELPPEELFALFSVGTIQQRDTMKVTTGLKALIGQFIRPESGLAKATQQVYGVGFRDAIKERNFVQILSDIKDRLGDKEFERAVGTNVDAANIALALVDSLSEFNSTVARIEESQGKFAKDVAFAMMSPAERYERAIAQLQDIRFTLGERAMPGIEKLADAMKEVVTRDRIEAFISLGDSITAAIPTFAKLAQVLAAAGTFHVDGYSILEGVFFAALGARAGRGLGGMVGGGRRMAGAARARGGAATAATVAQTGASGAAVGSLAGPIGAAIGGGIGLLGGFIIDRLGRGTNQENYDPLGFGSPARIPTVSGLVAQADDMTQAERVRIGNMLALLDRGNDALSDEAKRKLAKSLYEGTVSFYNPEGDTYKDVYAGFRGDTASLYVGRDAEGGLATADQRVLSATEIVSPSTATRILTKTDAASAARTFHFSPFGVDKDGTPTFYGTGSQDDYERPEDNWAGVDVYGKRNWAVQIQPSDTAEGLPQTLLFHNVSLEDLADFSEFNADRALDAWVDGKNDIVEAISDGSEDVVAAVDKASGADGRYGRGRYGIFNFQQIDNARDASAWSS